METLLSRIVIWLSLVLFFLTCNSAMFAYGQQPVGPDGTDQSTNQLYLPLVIHMDADPVATAAPTATSTDTVTATSTDTVTATPTDTVTATPTDTVTATPTDTVTAMPTDTVMATPTDTPTLTPTATNVPCSRLSGVINSELTLTEGCEYIVVEPLLISESITLTVMPGVTLRFSPGTYIRVDGIIRAMGSDSRPILFTIENQENQAVWSGIRITSKSDYLSILEHVIIEYGAGNLTSYAVVDISQAQAKLSHILFRYNRNPVRIRGDGASSKVTLSNSKFISNTGRSDVLFVDFVLENNLFENNQGGAALRVCPSGTVSNTVFIKNDNALEIGDCYPATRVNVSHNSFTNNGIAIRNQSLEPVQINYNNIISNTLAFTFASTLCNTAFNYNNVDVPFQPPFRAPIGSCSGDFRYNWWGTSDISTVDSWIYDYTDDFELQKVNFEPISTVPIPDAGANWLIYDVDFHKLT